MSHVTVIQVTKHDTGHNTVTYITVTQSYDTEKNIEDSGYI